MIIVGDQYVLASRATLVYVVYLIPPGTNSQPIFRILDANYRWTTDEEAKLVYIRPIVPAGGHGFAKPDSSIRLFAQIACFRAELRLG